MADKRIHKKNLTVVLGGLDLTPYANRVEVDPTLQTPDSTTLDDEAHQFEAGLLDWKYSADGFFEAATADPHSFLRTLTAAPLIIADGRPAAPGALALVIDATKSKFGQVIKLGDLWGFKVEGMAKRRSGWGNLIDRNAALNASGQSSEIVLPAIAEGEELLLVQAVHGGTAGTLDVVVQSDEAGFPSPIARATFAQVAAAAAPTFEIQRVPGPITDTRWRNDYTVTGGGDWGLTLAAAIV